MVSGSSTSTFNSLPRRSITFERNTPVRRSAGPLESHLEYFVPRSVSEFNLTGVGDIAFSVSQPSQQHQPPPSQQQHQIPQQAMQRRSPPPSILSHTRSTGTIMIPIQEMQSQHHQQHQQQQPQQPQQIQHQPQTSNIPMKHREKMVTFEDDPKPSTPRRTLPMSSVGDVFM